MPLAMGCGWGGRSGEAEMTKGDWGGGVGGETVAYGSKFACLVCARRPNVKGTRNSGSARSAVGRDAGR